MRVPQPPPEPMENQMVRLPPAVRRQVRALADRHGIRPAVLYRAYIENGVRSDMRRLRGVLPGDQDPHGPADTRTGQETF
jgi:hypothetical protein